MSIPKRNSNKPTDGLVNLMNQFNNVTDDEKENELKWIKYLFFHINVCWLTKNFDDFNILLSALNISFKILAITETSIKKDLSNQINLQLSNYLTEHTRTESSADATLFYISKRLSYQLRNDPGKM